MKDFKIFLKERKEICENTLSFIFDTSDTQYKFEAGQYAHFTIENPLTEDAKGNSRPLSIASSPHIKNSIMIAARKGSSDFVKNLSEVPIGSAVYASQPEGDFIPDYKSNVPSVFIAGGIGITPVRSIMEKAAYENSGHKMFLLYSNRTKNTAAFMEDFIKWEKEIKGFEFIPVIEQKSNDISGYETGTVSKEILKKYLGRMDDKKFFLVGPPLMVDSVKTILLNENVNEEMIKTEKFK